MKIYTREVDNAWDFRTADTKEYTHCYHTYPAMMIPQVARKLINEYKPQGEFTLLLDPYMGSGTSLVEASLVGVDSIGTDLNPLARRIASAKTTHYDATLINKAFIAIQKSIFEYHPDKVLHKNFDRISNYTFGYNETDLLKLSYLQQVIESLDYGKDFFNIAISETVREVSFTRNGEFKRYKMSDSSLQRFKPDVFGTFASKVVRNISGLISYNKQTTESVVSVYGFNSTFGIPSEIIPDESVDMVVTSPPYGDSHTTVAYGQFSRWANEWFGDSNAKNLDRLLMGGNTKVSEEEFTTESIRDVLDKINEADAKRYKEVVSFLNDYWHSISNVAKTIRKGGVICYVVGNRNVKGQQIPLDFFTAEMFEKCGFRHIITKVREIPSKRMPSKNSPTNVSGVTISTMNNEYIVIMKKTA